jgi:ornithine carbamoyltransferase
VRNFLSLADFSHDEITALLDDADDLSEAWSEGQMPRCLSGRRIALWFFDQGFRNRVAFDIGAQAMGAQVSFIPGSLGRRENVADMAAYLANWFSAVVVRAEQHGDLLAFAESSKIPVINARTNHNHPCEVLGDLHFVRRVRRTLDGLRVVFVGEAGNLCYPWLEAAHSLPISVTQICPPGYEADQAELTRLSKGAVGQLAVSHDLDLVQKADVIYTDCWPQRQSDEDREKVKDLFSPYQITSRLLDSCKSETLFLPCPPVTRGEEANADALKHPCCRVYEAKTYLLHTQNAIMRFVLGAC